MNVRSYMSKHENSNTFLYHLYCRGVSHSVVSDMKVIEQERPRGEPDRRYSRERDFDDFEFISSGGFSSGPPK